MLLIGSANAVFDDIRNHSKPFYEFFRLFFLRGLGREDCLCLLEALAEHEGRKEFPDMLNREGGRLETIRRLTGGNPRLLVLACRMLIESPFGSAFEDLERLIDDRRHISKPASRNCRCRPQGVPLLGRKMDADAGKGVIRGGETEFVARQCPTQATGGKGLRERSSDNGRKASPVRSGRPILQHLLPPTVLAYGP